MFAFNSVGRSSSFVLLLFFYVLFILSFGLNSVFFSSRARFYSIIQLLFVHIYIVPCRPLVRISSNHDIFPPHRVFHKNTGKTSTLFEATRLFFTVLSMWVRCVFILCRFSRVLNIPTQHTQFAQILFFSRLSSVICCCYRCCGWLWFKRSSKYGKAVNRKMTNESWITRNEFAQRIQM